MKSHYDPLLDHQKILGATLVNRLTDRDKGAVLVDGRARYSRHDLVMRFHTGNVHAARNLQKLMKRLKLNSIKEIFQLPGEVISKEHGFGPTTMFVLIAIGKVHGVDIDKWWTYGVTVDGLKARVQKDELAEKKEVRKRAAHTRHKTLRTAGTRILKAGSTNGATAYAAH